MLFENFLFCYISTFWNLLCFNWWRRIHLKLSLWTLIQKKRSKLNLEMVLASLSWLDLWLKPNLVAVDLLLVKQTATFNCPEQCLRSCFISNRIMWKMSCGLEDVLKMLIPWCSSEFPTHTWCLPGGYNILPICFSFLRQEAFQMWALLLCQPLWWHLQTHAGERPYKCWLCL